METKVFNLVGPKGETVRLIAPVDTKFPSIHIEDYGPYCGAGKGIGNTVVPESIWGLRISVACFIHDTMWDKAERTWADFHQSNSVFLKNILTIIIVCSRNGFMKRLRLYPAVTYYNAVDSLGQVFWRDVGGEPSDVTDVAI